MERIAEATSRLDLVEVAIDQGTSGEFLSGFLGLHGLAYHEQAADNLAAGHIHVGGGVSTRDARTLMIETLRTVLADVPAGGR